ncbi:MAG: primosomal protein N' [Rhodobacterales bacterium]|nr:primosomal protein N' [Rhodobacterales bacterium]
MQDFYNENEPIAVVTTEPFARFLDYLAPEGGCQIGSFLLLPLGKRRVLGVVWGPGEGKYERAKLRNALSVIDVPPMSYTMRKFLEGVSDYTVTPLNLILKLSTRVSQLHKPAVMQKVFHIATNHSQFKKTPKRNLLISSLIKSKKNMLTKKEIVSISGVSTAVITAAARAGLLKEELIPRDSPYPLLDPNFKPKEMNSSQSDACKLIRDFQKQAKFSAILLQGVTGSGKTEVYLDAVATALKNGEQVLVLLPEIALTSEFFRRVKDRFGAIPAEWHSGVSVAERRRVWKMVGSGGAKLVIGARSALFSTVILASATPSLESWVNAKNGKYHHIYLAERFGQSSLPYVAAIDLRKESLQSNEWISKTLEKSILKCLDNKEQVLLFLNRRGYSPTTVCRACGNQISCNECDARMVEHRFIKRLMCHQCGDTKPMPEKCPSCGEIGQLSVVGPGVERLAEEVQHKFPAAVRSVLSSDLYGSAKSLKAEIQNISEGNVDIIIGTQLVAKGHNFPKLRLVGVIDVDIGLQGSDFRASERTYQLVRQVSGRAGRVDNQGKALIQTYQPEHPVVEAILKGNDEEFWRSEANQRELAAMPPFGRLVGIIVSSTNFEKAMDTANQLKKNTDALDRLSAKVYGPALAPVARIKGRHRLRFLIKSPKNLGLQEAVRNWVATISLKGDVRLVIDIDPQTFY